MHGLYLMTAHSKMLQNTRLIKGKSPSSCVRIYPQGSEQRALYLDQKTNMKSSPPPCADDILWVVILIFDVYALFFLSHFDSVPAKIQPWGKKKKKAKNFKALNAERMSVSSRKGNCAHVPYRELVFQPHGLRSQAHWPWETRAFVHVPHNIGRAWFIVNTSFMLKWILVTERSPIAITFSFSFQDLFSSKKILSLKWRY